MMSLQLYEVGENRACLFGREISWISSMPTLWKYSARRPHEGHANDAYMIYGFFPHKCGNIIVISFLASIC